MLYVDWFDSELFIKEFLSVNEENKENTIDTKPQIRKYYGNSCALDSFGGLKL